MKKFSIFLILMAFKGFSQTNFVDPAGTKLDSSNVLGGLYVKKTALVGTTNYHAKFTGTNTLGNSLIFDDGTNVGIGTTSPTSQLHLLGSYNSSATNQLIIQNSNIGNSAATRMALINNAGEKASFFLSSSNNTGIGTANYATFSGSKGVVLFTDSEVASGGTSPFSIRTGGYDAANERFRITSAGRVGIATTSPVSLLANTSSSIIASNSFGTSTNSLAWLHSGPGFAVAFNNPDATGHGLNVKVAGTTSGTTAFEVGTGSTSTTSTPLFNVLGNGNVGIGLTSPATKLEVKTGTAGTSGFRLTNLTNSTAGTSTYSGLLGVNSTGDVGIGTVTGTSLSGFTAGQVTFGASTGGGLTQSANLFWDNTNGRLGIGTSAPLTKLHIPTKDIFTSLQNYTGTSIDGGAINVYTNSGSDGSITYSRALDIVAGSTVTGTAGAGMIRFLTNTNAEGQSANMSEKLRIHSNGNIGIGTTTPQYPLDISKTSGATGLLVGTVGTSGTDQSTINLATKYNQTSAMGTTGNKGYQIGARGDAWGTSALANSLFISLFDGSAWNSRLIVSASGNVGIGNYASAGPGSKFEVDGAATNKTAYNAALGGSSTTIDFSNSNLAYTAASAGAFTLTNLKDGGTYTLAVQGATSGTSSFIASGFTIKTINNGVTAASKHTLYTLLVMGTTVYVFMATGF